MFYLIAEDNEFEVEDEVEPAPGPSKNNKQKRKQEDVEEKGKWISDLFPPFHVMS